MNQSNPIAARLAVAVAIATWQEEFKRWARPFSDTEEEKAENAANVIRTTLKAYPALAGRNVEVYATGSYRNNTNVRGESDIDVAAVCRDAFFHNLPPLSAPGYGVMPAEYSFAAFRADVHAALKARFGSGMTPGDKALNIHENTHRLDADVTPFFPYRFYTGKFTPSGEWDIIEGVQSISRSNALIINWHKDHYRESVARNLATRKRFKRIARILKNVRFDMLEHGNEAAKLFADTVPSFLIECLVYNAPDECYVHSAEGYVYDVRNVISNLTDRTNAFGDWNSMLEVSRRKLLFQNGQPWSREATHHFLRAAWGHLFNE